MANFLDSIRYKITDLQCPYDYIERRATLTGDNSIRSAYIVGYDEGFGETLRRVNEYVNKEYRRERKHKLEAALNVLKESNAVDSQVAESIERRIRR